MLVLVLLGQSVPEHWQQSLYINLKYGGFMSSAVFGCFGIATKSKHDDGHVTVYAYLSVLGLAASLTLSVGSQFFEQALKDRNSKKEQQDIARTLLRHQETLGNIKHSIWAIERTYYTIKSIELDATLEGDISMLPISLLDAIQNVPLAIQQGQIGSVKDLGGGSESQHVMGICADPKLGYVNGTLYDAWLKTTPRGQVIEALDIGVDHLILANQRVSNKALSLEGALSAMAIAVCHITGRDVTVQSDTPSATIGNRSWYDTDVLTVAFRAKAAHIHYSSKGKCTLNIKYKQEQLDTAGTAVSVLDLPNKHFIFLPLWFADGDRMEKQIHWVPTRLSVSINASPDYSFSCKPMEIRDEHDDDGFRVYQYTIAAKDIPVTAVLEARSRSK